MLVPEDLPDDWVESHFDQLQFDEDTPRRSLLHTGRTLSRLFRDGLERIYSDRSDNSQGYRYFYSNRLYRRGSLSHAFHRIWNAVSPRRWAGEESMSMECARDSELDLSEMFGRTSSLKEPQLKVMDEYSQLTRSEEMVKCQLIVVRDAAYHCVAEIGKYSNCQFEDLNAQKSPFQRTYVREVRWCEELERSLRFLERQIAECNPLIPLKPIDSKNITIPTKSQMVGLKNTLTELEKNLRELNSNDEKMKVNLNEMVEMKHVMEKVNGFFQVHMEKEAEKEIEEEGPASPISSRTTNPFFPPETETIPLHEGAHHHWFVTGVIQMEKKYSFERVLWRACRRTAFVRITEIDSEFVDPITLSVSRQCVFIVFFKGESLRLIVDKVCAGFNARQYPCPKTPAERKDAIQKTSNRISDLTTVIKTTQRHKQQILSEAAEKLPQWLKFVHIQKAVFHTLNRLTVDTNGFLGAECWIPRIELERVKKALEEGVRKSGTDHMSPILNAVQTRAIPPTYNKTNKFTHVFQSIVDSYGVANYREMNPAPYTIITFPFLFAVMFGDIAHGFILFLCGFMFVLNEKRIQKARIKGEIFNTFYGGRYIIILMGLFSMYTGFIYNDAFGRAFNIFGSSWKNPYSTDQLDIWVNVTRMTHKKLMVTLDPATAYDTQKGPYLFGLDPIWNVAENRLSFINSMKMKLSVTLGIAQMTFGVVLSYFNHRFFKSRIDIYTNFIPQMVFLTSIFTYLVVQIFLKWIFFSVHPGNIFGYEYPGTHCAPSLLIGLINMFMMKPRLEGFVNENGETHPNCHLTQWYPLQKVVEPFLLFIAFLCVPIMLFGKPLYVYLRKGSGSDKIVFDEESLLGRGEEEVKEVEKKEEKEGEDGEEKTPPTASHPTEETHEISDLLIHQGIHTIEFVLGCVSHTASYLRLWALSLAHAQLSEVLWDMVLMHGITFSDDKTAGSIITYFAFLFFSSMTFFILVMMEGLSAFLHALRLHWVEFQSKFYQGGGIAFQPLSLRKCLEQAQHISELAEGGEEEQQE